jgi:hypothetical protein
MEINFAYHFEANGRELDYEVKQDPERGSSIDFRRKVVGVADVYFELRLMQQAREITLEIAKQLEELGEYKIVRNGRDEQAEIGRIQSSIQQKVVDADGRPTKFFLNDPGAVNIVTVDASDAILGMLDFYDCKLGVFGDPTVGGSSIDVVCSGFFKKTCPRTHSAFTILLLGLHT